MLGNKYWQKPSFILAIALTILFLVFGLTTFFGAGSGLVQWVIGAVCVVIIVGLWIAVYRGATTLKEAAHGMRDQGRDVRQNFDRDR